MSIRDQIYRWIDGEEADQWTCKHIKQAIIGLEKSGNRVIEKGLVNYKSPEAIFFLESPVHDQGFIDKINESSHLAYANHERAKKQVIACEKDYVTLVYELS